MNLSMDPDVASGYTSKSQAARRVTESWAEGQLYCVNCLSDRLSRAANNTPVFDFKCRGCDAEYQLKAGRRLSLNQVPDGAYNKMIQAVREERRPHLLLLQYSPEWTATDLLAIPRFFFTESTIRPREPLQPSARRKGWRGCNIDLRQIPDDGRIEIIHNGVVADSRDVRRRFKSLTDSFAGLGIEVRGWALDVLRVIRQLRTPRFELADMYRFESDLKNLHRRNENIRPKIRQQLQVLRNLGFIQFGRRGEYFVVRPAFG